MWKIAIIGVVVSIILVCTWRFLNWVWFKPKRIERFFRKQGMKGTSYKFLYGDNKIADQMYVEAYSKPIALHDDILPRIMPSILHTIQNYGNFSFTWSGPRPRVFVMDTGVIREMMSNYRKYHKSFKIANPINKMLVTGLAVMEGDQWNKARSKISPAFHLNQLKPMVGAIQVCCEEILDQWNDIMITTSNDECMIDVSSYLEVFTSSVLAQLMFSSTYTEQIKQTFLQLSELSTLGKLAMYSLTLPGEKYFPTRKNRRAKEIDKFVRASFTSLINERLEKRKAEEDDSTKDLLDIFMVELYEEEKSLTEKHRQEIIEDVIGQCKIFFFAGYETSSNVLCWTMITLSVHQDWQNRAREEVHRVLGDKKDITSDDLGKLKIVTMIVHEMLRLYPSGMEFSRIVEEDTKLGDYDIPKDTMLTCPMLMIHRNKEIWGEDAGKFNPERFEQGVVKATKGENAFMPFGWGPRICIAQNFAMVEIKLFVALLVRAFSMDLSPTYTHAPYVDFTIYPQYGAPLILKKL